ncbi:MAG: TonB family protein [Deltaproteobacteria bacterium]|nr:TonB family protein [Deltaproteobacteria bacterium]
MPAPTKGDEPAVPPGDAPPRRIGLNLDGAVTGGGSGVALPTGEGFPAPGETAPGQWSDGTEPGPATETPEAPAEAPVAGPSAAEREAARAAEAAAEAREALENADADGDGALDEAEKAEAEADRKHDAVETKSLRKVRLRPKVVENVEPAYPEELRELEVEGVVALELVVDEEGRVTSVKVLRRLHPTLDGLAKEAALRLRFSPATDDGTPVQVKIPWEFVFVLE